ESDTVGWSW
nr:Chain C, peptide [Neuraminidase deficient flu strains]